MIACGQTACPYILNRPSFLHHVNEVDRKNCVEQHSDLLSFDLEQKFAKMLQDENDTMHDYLL